MQKVLKEIIISLLSCSVIKHIQKYNTSTLRWNHSWLCINILDYTKDKNYDTSEISKVAINKFQ